MYDAPLKAILIPLFFAMVGCSSSGVRMSKSAQQQSLSDGALGQNIRGSISNKELSTNASCSRLSVNRVSLQSSARGASGTLMTAREYWYIDRCGREIIYQIDYYGPIHENTPIDVKELRR